MKKKLSNPNPYNVLGISQAASNAEITKAFAMAVKCREYPPDTIAKARKSLMNTQERLMADYLRPILLPIHSFKRENFSALEASAPSLEFLPEFDRLEEGIVDTNQTSETDKRLGLTLFSASPIQSPRVNKSILAAFFTLPVLFGILCWGLFTEREQKVLLNSTSLSPSPQSQPLASNSISSSSPAQSQPVTSNSSFSPPPTESQSFTTSTPEPISSAPRSFSKYQSSSYNFPLNSCGDEDSGGTNTWYPVFVDDPEENLISIQTNYCRDAFRKYRKNKEMYSIQVASFLKHSEAQEFAELMRRQVGSGEVGEPSIYDFEVSLVNTSSKSLSSNTNISYYFPLDSCGDRHSDGINTWYPVYIDDTEENLKIIRSSYCRDAIRNYREDVRIHSIQVASFLNRSEAQEFAELMQRQVGSGEVGEPTTY